MNFWFVDNFIALITVLNVGLTTFLFMNYRTVVLTFIYELENVVKSLLELLIYLTIVLHKYNNLLKK